MPEFQISDNQRLSTELASLRQQERLYRELFEESLGLMCVHDLEGVLSIVNPAAARSLGFSPEEGVGMNLKAFLSPAVRPLFDEYLNRIRRHGQDSGLMRLMARDGTERIWLYRNILYEEPGAPARVLGHAQDITERIRAEEAVKESERRSRILADTAPVFLWLTDTAGNYTFVNQPWLEFVGRTLAEETGQGRLDDLHPEDRAEAVAVHQRAFAARCMFQAEYRVRRSDGEYRWMLDTGKPHYNSRGIFAGYIGSCLDITEARNDREALRIARDELAERVAERTAELQKTNEALRQSEQHYQDLAELSPVGIFRTDREGRCVYLNRRACQIVGVTTGQARQGRWDEVLQQEDRMRLAAEWRKAVETGETGSLEHRIVRADGTTTWALTYLAAERDADGRIAGCIGTVADISDRKQAEEEKRQLELQVQYAQRLQSLGILAGGLAHDFNNLLTVIVGNARMARLDVPPRSRAMEKLVEIETASTRAAELTSQMLAYAGKGSPAVYPVNVSLLVDETAHLLRTVVSQRISLELALTSDLPDILADPAQIRQVAMNLITNAAEAIADQEGVISVRTGAMDADAAYLESRWFAEKLPPGRYVYLEVRDTGCGMTPEIQAQIFDPFFSTKFTGRGLGLAAVIGIVRAHRGVVKVSSEPGHGSVFQLLFPAAREAQTAVRPALPAGKKTVLVVDDEMTLRHLVRAILERSGYDVLTAADGGEAIRVFRSRNAEIGAVVLDLSMPLMSGEDTAAELWRIRPDTRIIVSSGYGERASAGHIGDRPEAAFLRKPYEPAALLKAVATALGG